MDEDVSNDVIPSKIVSHQQSEGADDGESEYVEEAMSLQEDELLSAIEQEEPIASGSSPSKLTKIQEITQRQQKKQKRKSDEGQPHVKRQEMDKVKISDAVKRYLYSVGHADLLKASSETERYMVQMDYHCDESKYSWLRETRAYEAEQATIIHQRQQEMMDTNHQHLLESMATNHRHVMDSMTTNHRHVMESMDVNHRHIMESKDKDIRMREVDLQIAKKNLETLKNKIALMKLKLRFKGLLGDDEDEDENEDAAAGGGA